MVDQAFPAVEAWAVEARVTVVAGVAERPDGQVVAVRADEAQVWAKVSARATAVSVEVLVGVQAVPAALRVSVDVEAQARAAVLVAAPRFLW